MTASQKISRQLSLVSQSTHESQIKYQYGPHSTLVTLSIVSLSPKSPPSLIQIDSSTLSSLELKLLEQYFCSMMDIRFRYPGKMLLVCVEQLGVLDYTLGSVFEACLYSLLASGLEMERSLVPLVLITRPRPNTSEHDEKNSTKKWILYQPAFKTPQTESMRIYNQNMDSVILFTFEHQLMVGSFCRSGVLTQGQLRDATGAARQYIQHQRNIVSTLARKFLSPPSK